MNDPLRSIVIVGGGTAGWLSACTVAARAAGGAGIAVTLVESPDVPIVGVGEGTFPTMRGTLKRIGISEADFLRSCDATFKQGARFDGWVTGARDDRYYHPFVRPDGLTAPDIVAAWHLAGIDRPFASAICPQPTLCDAAKAPRLPAMPDYAGAQNYGYHLDAGKFAARLKAQAVDTLGVRHVVDHVVAVERGGAGEVAAIRLRGGDVVTGDLFLDCTGHARVLIGDEGGWQDRADVLFNDRALAVQMPVAADSPIASQTIATAHGAGWIWDIGLPTRRGIGCVYASRFCSDEAAEATLAGYVREAFGGDVADGIRPRRLRFAIGHLSDFWVRNVVAIGLSAGFVDPLEATSIATVEYSLTQLLDYWPASRATMPLHAERFNTLFRFRWDRIIEFLKLHYVLSQRAEPYWAAHRDAASVPARLADLLVRWRDHAPSINDLPSADELFPAASYQYVLYGMGFPPPLANPFAIAHRPAREIVAARVKAEGTLAVLPTNRAYRAAMPGA